MTESNFALNIEGMHCGGCVRRVTAALANVPGLSTTKVEVGRAEGSFDSTTTNVDQIVNALSEAGFTSSAVSNHG